MLKQFPADCLSMSGEEEVAFGFQKYFPAFKQFPDIVGKRGKDRIPADSEHCIAHDCNFIINDYGERSA